MSDALADGSGSKVFCVEMFQLFSLDYCREASLADSSTD